MNPVQITVTPISSRILGFLDPKIVNILDQVLSYEQAGAQWSPKFQSGGWDGRKHLFSVRTMAFPSGLLSLVLEALDFQGIAYKVTDSRSKLVLEQPIPFKVPLYDWQEEIVQTSLAKQYGIIKSPTGSGKGVMMCATIARINKPTLLLTHKRDLLWQLSARWKEYTGTEMGVVGAGKIDIKKINIAMVQTVARVFDAKYRRSKYEEADDTPVTNPGLIKRLVQSTPVVILDESHRVVAKTIYTILKNCQSAHVKLGYSATPYRDAADDLLVEAAFGVKIVNITIPWLVENKYLAKPTLYFIKFKHKRAPISLNYPELYVQEIVDNLERNKLIVKLAYQYYQKGEKVLIAVTYLKHGRILEQMLKELVGDDVRFVNGELSQGERQDLPKELSSGEFKIGICTTVWSEGVDIPEIGVLINAKCGESKVATLQIAGRALRKTNTKDKALLLDFYDYGCRFFENHSKSRLEAFKEEGLEVKFIESSKL